MDAVKRPLMISDPATDCDEVRKLRLKARQRFTIAMKAAHHALDLEERRQMCERRIATMMTLVEKHRSKMLERRLKARRA